MVFKLINNKKINQFVNKIENEKFIYDNKTQQLAVEYNVLFFAILRKLDVFQ